MWGRFCLKLKKNGNLQVAGILCHILQNDAFCFYCWIFFCIKKVHVESPDQFFEKIVFSFPLLLAAAASP